MNRAVAPMTLVNVVSATVCPRLLEATQPRQASNKVLLLLQELLVLLLQLLELGAELGDLRVAALPILAR